MEWLNGIVGLMTLILVILAVLTLGYFIWNNWHQDLKIKKATYGKNKIYKDITEHLNNRIIDDKLELQLTNNIVGDPVKGIIKIAKIRYWHGGKKHTREYVETEIIKLP